MRTISLHDALPICTVPEHPLPDLIRLQVISELIDIQTKLLGIGEEDLLGRSVRPLRLTVKNHVVHRLLLTLFSRRLNSPRCQIGVRETPERKVAIFNGDKIPELIFQSLLKWNVLLAGRA